MALAVPAAGGVQTAFGTDSKSLQVGFAAEAGLRAARLARAGATADPRAVDTWLHLLGGGEAGDVEGIDACIDTTRPAVPGGLAVKMFPCCYAMQRPIAALRTVRDQIDDEVTRIRVTTPAATLQPLAHDRPRTGLEGKFSMPYAIAATLLDDYPVLASFTDAAVNRPAARWLLALVEVDGIPGGAGLLDGEVDIRVELANGRSVRTRLAQPPGSPRLPASAAALHDKFVACGPDVPALLRNVTWDSARELMRATFPRRMDALL